MKKIILWILFLFLSFSSSSVNAEYTWLNLTWELNLSWWFIKDIPQEYDINHMVDINKLENEYIIQIYAYIWAMQFVFIFYLLLIFIFSEQN